MSNSFVTPWTVTHQALLSMGFPRKKYWNGLPYPSSGDLLDLGTELTSPALTGRFFTTEPTGKLLEHCRVFDISVVNWCCYYQPQNYDFSNSHIQMWELGHKEGWVLKNWCFQIVVWEKTLESSLDSKEIKPANPKGYQLWIFIGRTDAEAKTPVLWPLDANSWLFGKYPDAGKDWRQEEKGVTEDEMLGWDYRLNRHEFE